MRSNDTEIAAEFIKLDASNVMDQDLETLGIDSDINIDEHILGDASAAERERVDTEPPPDMTFASDTLRRFGGAFDDVLIYSQFYAMIQEHKIRTCQYL